jgi:hypothetical protein
MKTDREKRPIFCIATPDGLKPSNPYDAEVLDRIKHGSEVEITIKHRRSPAKLKEYWWGLHKVIAAADDYPSAEHLHDAIKFALKMVTPVMTLTGKMIMVPDSVALAKMDDAEFSEFFKRAQRLVIERFGFDPWERKP